MTVTGLPLEPSMQLVDQVLELHVAGIRQTYLKPQNVLLGKDEEVTIIDAGSFAFQKSEVGTHRPHFVCRPERMSAERVL